MRRTCLRLLLGVIAFWEATVVAQESYKFLNEIPIGGEGGWDILTIDSAASRLYLSHATKVVVVDLNKNAIAGEIADTPGVHAFMPVPELQRGFSSNGKESKSSIVDLATLKTLSKIETGQNPDAIAYEPQRGEVYIFNHTGNSVTVIDAKQAKVVATIPLGGGLAFLAFLAGTRSIPRIDFLIAVSVLAAGAALFSILALLLPRARDEDGPVDK